MFPMLVSLARILSGKTSGSTKTPAIQRAIHLLSFKQSRITTAITTPTHALLDQVNARQITETKANAIYPKRVDFFPFCLRIYIMQANVTGTVRIKNCPSTLGFARVEYTLVVISENIVGSTQDCVVVSRV